MLARMKPEDVGMGGPAQSQVLERFQLSLLTQGSGTQIFSTTFVQWAGRECLRRAQPMTMVLRYAPRQRQQTMNAMLSGSPPGGPDAAGSLIDADMGAYSTWLNLQRLPGRRAVAISCMVRRTRRGRLRLAGPAARDDLGQPDRNGGAVGAAHLNRHSYRLFLQCKALHRYCFVV